MPWKEQSTVDQRVAFIRESAKGLLSMAELCEQYGISRTTGYKWLARSDAGESLSDRSRRPHRSPHRTPLALEREIVAERLQHPTWGPDKIRRRLLERRPDAPWPSSTTMGEIFKRHDLVQPRGRRRRAAPHAGKALVEAEAPNVVWTVDFKGEFRMGNRRYCYPLTVADRFSRYLLVCGGMPAICGGQVQEAFSVLFREYGLPCAILSDNGSPFASGHSLLGLTRLSVWWMRLNILPVRITPGCPQQNGCHERMHRTLKAETTRPPGADLADQQARFDRFRAEYNQERPHAALDMQPPARLYQPSPRPMPTKLERPEYPGHYQVRHVRPQGTIRFRGRERFLSEALAGQWVGLEEVDDQVWSLWLAQFQIARLHERTGAISPVPFASRWPAPVGLRPPSAGQRDQPECQPCPR